MSKSRLLAALITFVFLHVVDVSALSRRARLPARGRCGPNGQNLSFKPKLSPEKQEYLNAHNAFRQKMNVPPLQWDEKLAVYAKSWALQRSVDDCDYKHHSKGPYGENIFWQQYDERSPTDIVNIWSYEQSNYDHQKFVCKCQPERDGCMCSHYTAIIWETTKSVGCGSAICNNEKGIYIVCAYNPKGNYIGVNPLNH